MRTTILLIALLLAVCSARITYEEIALPLIEQVNSNPHSTWEAELSPRFIGQSWDDIKKLMGTLDTPEYLKLEPKTFVGVDPSTIPENFNSTENWPECITMSDIRDQSACGSCWSFGASEAISDRICVASILKGTGPTSTRISSENLLTCCGFFCGNGCNGGYPAAAWRYWVNSGLVTGYLYNVSGYCQPYLIPPNANHSYNTPACQLQCVPGYNVTYPNDLHFGNTSYSLMGIQNIQYEIMTNGPIEGSFVVYSDFTSYKQGVYSPAANTTVVGGHAIKVIGWGVEGGLNYWLCANSWGPKWGINGFFKIQMGVCGIDNGMVAGIPKL